MSFFSVFKPFRKSCSINPFWQDCVVRVGVLCIRNLAGYPFAANFSDIWREEVICRFWSFFERYLVRKGFNWLLLDGEDKKTWKRWNQSLFVMPALNFPKGKVLAFKGDQGILVNHQDHFRIFAEAEDLGCLSSCFSKVDRLETLLGKYLEFAFDERIGFLTALPEQAGTGLQVMARIHLPALSFLYGVDKLHQWLKEKEDILVKGFGGKDKVVAHIFEISNYFALGATESELMEKVRGFVSSLCHWEKEVRVSFLSDPHRKKKLLERIRFLCSLGTEGDTPEIFLEYVSLLFLAGQLGIMVETGGFNVLKTCKAFQEEFLPIVGFLKDRRGRITTYV